MTECQCDEVHRKPLGTRRTIDHFEKHIDHICLLEYVTHGLQDVLQDMFDVNPCSVQRGHVVQCHSVHYMVYLRTMKIKPYRDSIAQYRLIIGYIYGK